MTMSLTSRERVLTTLNHEKPDRVPIVLGASNATGIKMVAYRRLKKLLNFEAPERYLYDFPELGTALIDEPMLERLHVDVRGVLDREPKHILEKNANREPDSMYVNSWGAVSPKLDLTTGFLLIIRWLKLIPSKTWKNIAWPDMDDPTRVAHVRAEAQKLHQENKYAIMATPWLAFPSNAPMKCNAWISSTSIWGGIPTFIQELSKKTGELCKTLMGHFLDECGDVIDIIKIGDDLGDAIQLDAFAQDVPPIMSKPFTPTTSAFIKSQAPKPRSSSIPMAMSSRLCQILLKWVSIFSIPFKPRRAKCLICLSSKSSLAKT
jgi:uroporphyrinogen decarboxylase